jgi:hypothetical protein
MIEVIVSADAVLRQKKKTDLMKKYPNALIADDTAINAEALRAYAYPSLFDAAVSAVIVSHAGDAIEFDAPLIKELAASPSQFFFFERTSCFARMRRKRLSASCIGSCATARQKGMRMPKKHMTRSSRRIRRLGSPARRLPVQSKKYSLRAERIKNTKNKALNELFGAS